MKPNTQFDLSVRDIELIELALFDYQIKLHKNSDKKEVVNLLAKLHHQKTWYRPTHNYVGG